MGAKTTVRVDSELSEVEVKVEIHQGSVLSLFCVVDVVTGLAREVVLCKLLYADDCVPMSEAIKGHKE